MVKQSPAEQIAAIVTRAGYRATVEDDFRVTLWDRELSEARYGADGYDAIGSVLVFDDRRAVLTLGLTWDDAAEPRGVVRGALASVGWVVSTSEEAS